MSWGWRCWLRVGCIGALLSMPFAHAEDLQPKVYASRSGGYTLTVDPEERNGGGKGRYTLQRGQATVWSAELPFALWDAVVADDGVVGGYAYTRGIARDDGDFVVAIIDAEGRIRTSERAQRAFAPYLHMYADPKATGLFLDAEHDRFVVRVADADANRNEEAWWTYRLSDGHVLGKPMLRGNDAGEGRLSVLAARPVAGTPLTLVEWMHSGCCAQDQEKLGAVFALIDPGANPVWTLALPNDYTKADADSASVVMRDIREHGAILDATAPRQFDLWHVADTARVRYAIASGPDGTWQVRESSRAPYHLPVAARPPAPSKVALAPIGSIVLDTSGASDVMHGIQHFSIADHDRFAFLIGCGCSGASDDAALAIVDRTGLLLRKIPLPPSTDAREALSYSEAWLGGDRWIVTRSTHGVGTRSVAFVVDGSTGALTRVDPFDAPEIRAVASTRDGGFVAITDAWSRHSSTAGLSAFDADGRLRWSVGQSYQDETKLFSADAVTVTSSGDVVVLETVPAALKIYDRNGAYRHTIDLKQAWKRDSRYLVGIEADRDDGIIVHDTDEKIPIVHMKLDGTVIRGYAPAFADGRRFSVSGGVQAAGNGALWTSDGNALLRLDTRGVVRDVVGSAPDVNVLGDVSGLAIGKDGAIYAADARTGAIHVFDGEGRRLHVCLPETNDYGNGLRDPSLTVADTGDVFVARHTRYEGDKPPDFLHYAPSGARIGIETLPVDTIVQEWLAQPGGTNRWVIGYDHVYLVDAKGEVVRAIERQASGRWLVQPHHAATAPDGSLAVVSNTPDVLALPESITVYARDGEALKTWPFPADGYPMSSAYDGQTIALLTGDLGDSARRRITLIDARTGDARQFEPAGNAEAIFLARRNGAAELWVFDGGKTIERYVVR